MPGGRTCAPIVSPLIPGAESVRAYTSPLRAGTDPRAIAVSQSSLVAKRSSSFACIPACTRRLTVLSSPTAEAREAVCLDFLDQLPRDLDAVLVGGYAVSAYGPARFSKDVDLVFPSDRMTAVRGWLKRRSIPFGQTFDSVSTSGTIRKLRVEHDLLSGDLYFGGVRARDTGAVIESSWIARDPRTIRLRLTTAVSQGSIAVARPEALWVLKLLAGRGQDVADLFAISSTPINGLEVRTELASLGGGRVASALRRVRERVERGDDYADSLSRRSLGSPSSARNRAAWLKFIGMVSDVIPL
jgi:hypothetical protein